MVVYTCNPSTWEAEAGGSPFRVQPGLHRETLSQKPKQTINNNNNQKDRPFIDASMIYASVTDN